jgi:hypothetical protein
VWTIPSHATHFVSRADASITAADAFVGCDNVFIIAADAIIRHDDVSVARDNASRAAAARLVNAEQTICLFDNVNLHVAIVTKS